MAINVRYEALDKFYKKITYICNSRCEECDFSHMCKRMEKDVKIDKYIEMIKGLSGITYMKSYREKSDNDRTIIKQEFLKRCLSGEERLPYGWYDEKYKDINNY